MRDLIAAYQAPKLLALIAAITLVLMVARNAWASGVVTIVDDATGGGCISVGLWNSVTKTCTLTTDVASEIVIGSDGITLDGNDHTVIGAGVGSGVRLTLRTDVTIRDMTVSGFANGIHLVDADGNTVEGVTANGNAAGIFLNSSAGNMLQRNTANANSQFGFHLFVDSDSNTVRENTADSNGLHGFFVDRNVGNALTRNASSNNQNGIFLNSVTGTSVTENIVDSNTVTGIVVLFSFTNSIFNNNLLDNTNQASDLAGGGNVFYQFPPVGGNYWSDLAGCLDGNSDGFCDLPHVFAANVDIFPLTDPVSIGDTISPTLVLPPSVVLNATSPDGVVHTYSVIATDDQDPAPVVVCNPVSGSVFPLGTTTVNCTATDASGNTDIGSFDVSARYVAFDYVVLGTHSSSVGLGTKSTVTNGIVGGNGKVKLNPQVTVRSVIAGGSVTVGTKSVAGNLTVDGKVTVNSQATTGDITASGSVKVGPKATTGTITEDAVVDIPDITLPAVFANPDPDNDVFRKQKDARSGPLDLLPGSYGKLQSASKDEINLVGGEYHFDEVAIKSGTSVMIDLTNGQSLTMQIAGNLDFGTKVRMEVVGGDASDIIVLVGGRKAKLGAGGTFVGTFIAPNGEVVLGTKATLAGAAWGSKVATGAQSSVIGALYDHDLP